jgi:multimeric flavodoxin WrbA
MNVVAINGSPRGHKSNTAVMITALTSAFDETDVTNLLLGDMKINYCTGCYSCWTKTPGKCIQNDDMASILEKLRQADILILGSPLYFNTISGTLKVFIDRLTALGGNPHEAHTTSDRKIKILMVSNCGYLIKKQFDAVSVWIHHFTAMLGGELLGEFYTTNGKMLQSSDTADINAAARYIQYLQQCSKNIQEQGTLTEELKQQSGKSIQEFQSD